MRGNSHDTIFVYQKSDEVFQQPLLFNSFYPTSFNLHFFISRLVQNFITQFLQQIKFNMKKHYLLNLKYQPYILRRIQPLAYRHWNWSMFTRNFPANSAQTRGLHFVLFGHWRCVGRILRKHGASISSSSDTDAA